jgi:hypothetical protein
MFYHGFDGAVCRVFGAKGVSLRNPMRMNGGRPLVNTSSSGWDAGTVGKRSIVQRDGYWWMVYEGSTDKVGDSLERSQCDVENPMYRGASRIPFRAARL